MRAIAWQASHGREPFKDLSIIAFVAVEFAIPMARTWINIC
jgi:hypothetical protein